MQNVNLIRRFVYRLETKSPVTQQCSHCYWLLFLLLWSSGAMERGWFTLAKQFRETQWERRHDDRSLGGLVTLQSGHGERCMARLGWLSPFSQSRTAAFGMCLPTSWVNLLSLLESASQMCPELCMFPR